MEAIAAATITTALTEALGTVATDMTGAITAVLPVAIPVVGAIMVITVGIKAFHKFTK